MGSGLRLGRILGFEIRLDYSWFLVFVLLAWSLSTGVFPRDYGIAPGLSWVLGICASLLLFASVLVHEIAHAVVARHNGIEVAGITLFLFGGVAQIKDDPETPGVEFLVAAVGPLVSIVLGAACLGASWFLPLGVKPGPVVALLNYLGVVNLALALFNLIPGFPLDGGRILRAIVWKATGNLRKATRGASLAGQAFGWLLVAYGVVFRFLMNGDPKGLWVAFVGWFLSNAAAAAYQQLLLRRALRGVSVADVMSQDVPVVHADTRVNEFVDNFVLRLEHGVYPVTRDEEFVGVVSVDDVRRLRRDLWGVTSVGAIAHVPEQERVVDDQEDAWDALTQMMESGSPRLLVMHEGRLEGIVSRDSIVRLVQRKMRLRLPAA